jgi:hypothetical protein
MNRRFIAAHLLYCSNALLPAKREAAGVLILPKQAEKNRSS